MEFRSGRRQNFRSLAIRSLGFNGVLIGLAFASMETIWPILLYSFYPNSSTVGFITAGLSIILLTGFAFLFPLFNKYSAKTLLFASVSLNALMFALFAYVQNPIIFLILAGINAIFMALRVQAFGILIKNNSSARTINKNENLMYLLANIGWIIGPLIAGFVANEFSVGAVLILASIFLVISVYSITITGGVLDHYKQKHMKNVSVFKNLTSFFSKKKRVFSYLFSAGLEIWWTLPYIFLPLEILKQGMDMSSVGLFLFFLCVPLFLTESIVQRKEIRNLKKLFFIGYLFAGVCALIAAFVGNIYLTMVMVVIASFGIGLVEPTAESYFFSIVNSEQATRYYGSFFTSKQIGSFFGRIVIATILLSLSLKYGILFVSIVMFVLASLATLKHKRKHARIHS